MQPGETITPGGQPPQQPEMPRQEVPAAPQPPSPPLREQEPVPEPSANWQFTGTDSANQSASATVSQQPVTWSASEYIAHAKGTAWFVVLGAGLFVLIAIVWLFTKDVLAAILVGAAGFSFGMFAARPPRTLQYSVGNRGIQIGQKLYPYQDFKSFALLEDGPLPSILLLPLKRFLPPITIFYDPKEEDAIIAVLGDYLPHEEKQPDIVDRIMSRIRF